MHKPLPVLAALALLSGCQRENNLHLHADQISSVEVIQFGLDNRSPYKQLTDRQKISELVNCLNHADEEINKFLPRYRLVIHTNGKTDSLLISGNGFKMDERRYNADCNIESLIR